MEDRIQTDLRGIDLAHFIPAAGPYCTKLLADFGAEVTKVESIQCMDMPTRVVSYPENDPGGAVGDVQGGN